MHFDALTYKTLMIQRKARFTSKNIEGAFIVFVHFGLIKKSRNLTINYQITVVPVEEEVEIVPGLSIGNEIKNLENCSCSWNNKRNNQHHKNFQNINGVDLFSLSKNLFHNLQYYTLYPKNKLNQIKKVSYRERTCSDEKKALHFLHLTLPPKNI